MIRTSVENVLKTQINKRNLSHKTGKLKFKGGVRFKREKQIVLTGIVLQAITNL